MAPVFDTVDDFDELEIDMMLGDLLDLMDWFDAEGIDYDVWYH